MKLKTTTVVTIITALIGMTNIACAHKAAPPAHKTTRYKKTSYKNTKTKTKRKSSTKQYNKSKSKKRSSLKYPQTDVLKMK